RRRRRPLAGRGADGDPRRGRPGPGAVGGGPGRSLHRLHRRHHLAGPGRAPVAARRRLRRAGGLDPHRGGPADVGRHRRADRRRRRGGPGRRRRCGAARPPPGRARRGPGEGRDPEHVRGPARRRPRPEAGDRPRPPQAGREHRCGAGPGRGPRGRSVGNVRLMCMLVVARRPHPRYPLIVVANRDEALERPTEPLHKWSSERDGVDGIVAGRDVTAGGTWLSLAAGGRFAAVTNVPEPGTEPSPISRGRLPAEALAGPVPATGYVRHTAPGLDQYAGVNLLAGDPDELWWASNRSERDPVALDERVHGLSNAQLDTPWPKVTGAVRDVQQLVDADRISGPDWEIGRAHV